MRRRVVSLVPSSTETLLALGADVVACTRFCEQPALVHVGGTKNPDIAHIVELAPDIVVMDREENRIEDHDALVAASVHVVVTEVIDVASALAVVPLLAAVGGVAIPPEPVLASPAASIRCRAFVPIWRRPWMTISPSTYGASVLDRIGVDLVVTGAVGAYPTVDLDAIERPDLVLIPSEPYDFQPGHVAELEQQFPAARVVEVDGRDLFWWGVRTPGAIIRLAEALVHPPTP